jgi:hypothetical protein
LWITDGDGGSKMNKNLRIYVRLSGGRGHYRPLINGLYKWGKENSLLHTDNGYYYLNISDLANAPRRVGTNRHNHMDLLACVDLLPETVKSNIRKIIKDNLLYRKFSWFGEPPTFEKNYYTDMEISYNIIHNPYVWEKIIAVYPELTAIAESLPYDKGRYVKEVE